MGGNSYRRERPRAGRSRTIPRGRSERQDPMIFHRPATATPSRWLRRLLAGLLAAAVGVLLAGQPQSARAATGDFEIAAQRGADGAAYLVRGGLPACDSTNNCTGGLTQPKTAIGTNGAPGWSNTILQVDTTTNNG